MANPQKEDGFTPIANEILEALCQINLSAYETRALLFILRKTYGWGKKEDRISLSQFAKVLNIAPPHICRALKKLVKRKIITQIGNGYYVSYSFQKDYHRWKSLPKQVISAKPLPKEVIGITQIGNKLLPEQVNTKDNTKDTNTKDILSGKPDITSPIEYLNLKTQRHFDPKNKGTQALIKARYAEGRTLEQFKLIIDKKVAEWLTDEKMSQYLRPSTLFNRINFENYLNQPDKTNDYNQIRKEFGLK